MDKPHPLFKQYFIVYDERILRDGISRLAIYELTEKLCNFLFIQQTFIQYILSGEHCDGYWGGGGQAHRRLLPALKVIRGDTHVKK